MDEDIVSTSGEIPEKFIKELHRLTTYAKIMDTLNILFLLNQEFVTIAEEILSPVQMYISHNDGMCNADLIHSRDTIINANTMKNLYEYTEEEIANIKALQSIA